MKSPFKQLRIIKIIDKLLSVALSSPCHMKQCMRTSVNNQR